MAMHSAWRRVPGTSGTPRTPKGMPYVYTHALRDLDLPEEDIWVLRKTDPTCSSTCCMGTWPLRT